MFELSANTAEHNIVLLRRHFFQPSKGAENSPKFSALGVSLGKYGRVPAEQYRVSTGNGARIPERNILARVFEQAEALPEEKSAAAANLRTSVDLPQSRAGVSPIWPKVKHRSYAPNSLNSLLMAACNATIQGKLSGRLSLHQTDLWLIAWHKTALPTPTPV